MLYDNVYPDTIEEYVKALETHAPYHVFYDSLDELYEYVSKHRKDNAALKMAYIYLTVMEICSKPSGFKFMRASFWCAKLARLEGNPVAMVIMGLLEARVNHDDKEAAMWFSKAARKGDADGMTLLACSLLEGRGVEKDPKRAVELLEKAHELGQVEATRQLGVCYSEGLGVEKDHVKAVLLLKTAVEKDSDDDAERLLEERYLNLEGFEMARRLNVEETFKKAEERDPGSQYAAGLLCFYGISMERDLEKAVGHFEKAARAKNYHAIRMLAGSYRHGLGVEKDEEKAAELYEEAAAHYMELAHKGDSEASLIVIHAYRHDEGVKLETEDLDRLHEVINGLPADDPLRKDYPSWF